MELAWNPSLSFGVSYKIYIGLAAGVYYTNLDVGNGTNAFIYGLTPGVMYYFAATAKDAQNVESPFSNETSYMITIVNGKPTLVLNSGRLVNTYVVNGQLYHLMQLSMGVANVTQAFTWTNGSSGFLLESSPDLIHWSPLQITPIKIPVGATSIPIVDPNTNSQQFYRIVTNSPSAFNGSLSGVYLAQNLNMTKLAQSLKESVKKAIL